MTDLVKEIQSLKEKYADRINTIPKAMSLLSNEEFKADLDKGSQMLTKSQLNNVDRVLYKFVLAKIL